MLIRLQLLVSGRIGHVSEPRPARIGRRRNLRRGRKVVAHGLGRLADEAYLEGLKEKSGLSARKFCEFLASLKGG